LLPEQEQGSLTRLLAKKEKILGNLLMDFKSSFASAFCGSALSAFLHAFSALE
jgi:hypothetical protein